MTTSSPVNAANIDNILDSIFKENPYRHNLKGRSFRGSPDCFDGLGLSANQERVLQYIIKKHYNNGFCKAKFKDISDHFKISISTVKRCVKKLRALGLIVAERFDRGLKYVLTNFYKNFEKLIAIFGRLPISELIEKYNQLSTEREIYIDQQQAENDNDEPEREVKMNHDRDQNDLSLINKESFLLENKRDDQRIEEATNETDKQTFEQGYFSKINYEGKKDEIEKSCETIRKLPRKRGIFRPKPIIESLIQSGIPASVVSAVLIYMADNWSKINDNPTQYFVMSCKNGHERQLIYNAKQEEMKNNKRKMDRGGFGFNVLKKLIQL